MSISINNNWLNDWETKQNIIEGYNNLSAFEKYKLCYYLTILVDYLELTDSKFVEFYKKLIFALRINKKRLPIIESKSKNMSYENEVNLKKELKFVLQKYAVKYNKLAQNKKSIIESKLSITADLYGLDNIEKSYLEYYVLKEVNKLIHDIHHFYDASFDEFTIFGIQVLKLKSWAIQQTRKRLIAKGIFLKREFSDERIIFLNSKIIQVFLDSRIKTSTQIKNILLGKNQKSELSWKDFEHIKNERDITFNILTSAIKNKTKGINILLYGSVGTGKTQLAKLLANKAKIDMYSVCADIMNKEATRKDRLSDLSSKQTILSKTNNSCLLFDEAEDVMNRGFSELGNASKAYLNTLLEETSVPIFWTTNDIYNVDPAFLRRMTYAIEFEKLSEEVRLNIWKKVLRKNKLKVNKEKLVELNKNYDIPPSLISNAIKTTKLINGNQDDFEGFIENVAKVVTKKKNVKKKKEFEMQEYNEKLINTDLNISDLTSKIKSCGKLNFSLCLYGESGTGKSLYARYLAKELGIEVILKRASDLMSKYIGETEQNIAEAFAEANSKKAMLIFDEADSFLQNRSNSVRSWEVSQVNEMLTWMESHEYPFVCTTNFLDSLDEASLRRFTFKIKFDFMTFAQVNSAIEHFWGIKNTNLNIKGLTAGDFATVKKKAEFLCITDLQEIAKMLEEEVKIKKSKELQKTIGFNI